MKPSILQRWATPSSLTGQAPRRRVVAAVAVLVSVALTAAACSSSSSKSGSSGSSGSTEASTTASSSPTGTTSVASGSAVEARVAQLLAPVNGVKLDLPPIKNLPDLKGKKVLVVPILGLVFARAITQVKIALSSVGLTTQVCDGQGNPSTVATCLSQAPSIAGLAGVMTIGVPYQLAENAITTVTAKHIPVLLAQQNPDGQPSGPYVGFVGTTKLFEVATKAAVDYVVAKSGGKANVLSLGLSDSADNREESAAMTNYFKSSCPGCKVTSKLVTSTSIDQATNVVSALYLQDPQLNWITSLNTDVSGQAVVKGLQSANAASKVSQGGIANGQLSLQQVAQGTARYAALISGNLLSWNFSDALLRLIAHNPVPTNYPVVVRLIDSTNIKSLNLNPAEASTFNWFGKASFPQDYQKLWAAS